MAPTEVGVPSPFGRSVFRSPRRQYAAHQFRDLERSRVEESYLRSRGDCPGAAAIVSGGVVQRGGDEFRSEGLRLEFRKRFQGRYRGRQVSPLVAMGRGSFFRRLVTCTRRFAPSTFY